MRHVVNPLLISILFIAGSVGVDDSRACVVGVPSGSGSPDLDAVAEKIELLWSGTRKERLQMVESSQYAFRTLARKMPEDVRERATELVNSLRQYLAAERDDWILSRLLAGMVYVDNDLLYPLFRDALDHPSPNVRRRGVQYFLRHRDPQAVEALEELWKREVRGWIRVELALALTCQESSLHAREILEYADSEHHALRRVAATALSRMKIDGAPGAIERLAVSGDTQTRVTALTALATRPASESTRSIFLEAVDHPSRVIRVVAMRGLAAYPDRETLGRLVHLAYRDPDSYIRRMASEALARAPSDLSEQALARVEPMLGGERELKLTRKIRRRLERSATLPEWPDPSRIGSCAMQPVNNDPDAPFMVNVQPIDDRATLRCWKSPGVPGHPARHPRLPKGCAGHLRDLFEGTDGVWRAVRPVGLAAGAICWVHSDDLETPEGLVLGCKDAAAALPKGRVEFDISADDLSGAHASLLLDSGLLRIFEPGAEVLGVVLETGGIDEAALEPLLAAFGYGNTVLDAQLAKVLAGLESRFPRHEGLRELLDRIKENRPKPR